MAANPTSEHDWTVRALNIHGVFFERWCAQALRGSGRWQVRSQNYPVKYPGSVNLPGKETAIDIWAECRQGRTKLSLIIECKKNNPEFVNWVFFGDERDGFDVYELENESPPNVTGWSCRMTRSAISSEVFVADEARETRGNYSQHMKGDKTKTSNAAISDAAYQVAIGTQALVSEEENRSSRLGESLMPAKREWSSQVVVPLIVTSARLYSASFDPRRVDGETGEIAPSDVELQERPYLIYRYALPRHLHSLDVRIESIHDRGEIERESRLDVVVVSSRHLGTFLESQFIDNLAA
jgi:hypothetical protein